MSDELKQAVSYWKRRQSKFDPRTMTMGVSFHFASILADAYIAHLDAEAVKEKEESQPVTLAWWKEFVGCHDLHDDAVTYEIGGVGFYCELDYFSTPGIFRLRGAEGGVWLPHIKTIGQVKRLIAALEND